MSRASYNNERGVRNQFTASSPIISPYIYIQPQQQDASDYLRLLLMIIDEDEQKHIKSACATSKTRTTVQDVFTFETVEIIKCGKCDDEHIRAFEPEIILTVEIPESSNGLKSIDEYLKIRFIESSLSGYKCNSCTTSGTSRSKLCLMTTSQILLIHLCRFKYDREKCESTKITTAIEFNDILDINPVLNNQPVEYHYSLYAAVVHDGETLEY
ncbi:unnamed protein product, partial [Didymodactylos carnosus]